MQRLAVALIAAAALALPALAQNKEAPKPDAAKKVEIPKNVFFKGQTAGQYLAKERLIGAKVVDKDGQPLGTVDDLILGQGGQIEGVILGVGGVLGVGAKQVGVRWGALKVSAADGKTTIALLGVSKAMLDAMGAYQRPIPAKK